MKYLASLFLIFTLLLAPLAQATPAAAATIPTITIDKVVTDTSVTIRTNNFPAHVTFKARMGKIGTLGIGGTVVGTTDSGDGGSFLVTYNIPAALKGSYMIAIRLDGTGGYFSYNWFVNNTTGVGPAPGTGFKGIPTFSIKSVVADTSVTILTKNFPAHVSFKARMGKMGTLGVNGTVVGTTDSGDGGAFEVTYNIPAGLKGQSQIAIRLDGTGGYFAYNWLYNSSSAGGATGGGSSSGGSGSSSTYTGFPRFSILSVVKDTSVTIKGFNFPPNDSFQTLMGPFGSLGVNGSKAEVYKTNAGGTFTATLTIPTKMKGASRIAIRLQSSTSGYFAYNWFYNSTTP